MSEPHRLEHVGDLGKGFSLHRGWSDTLAQQLVDHSLEDEIIQSTPRDANKRFRNLNTAHEWFETKQPIVYSLARSAELAGIIWFSHRQHEFIEADYTFAIRMYGTARGRHLAEPFAIEAEADFRSRTDTQGIWLVTDMSNSRARNLYHKLGYQVVEADSARITMKR